MLVSEGFPPCLRSLCAAWLGPRDVSIEPWDTLGFSGARLARVSCAATGASWMLKSFAPRTDPGRIAWIHGLMRHLRDAGVGAVPAVAVTPAGHTVVADEEGVAWELVEFVTGAATDTPSAAQAAAAVACLARIHLAAASFPAAAASPSAAPGAVLRRVDHAERLVASPWSGGAFRSPHGTRTEFQAQVAERLARAVAVFAAADGDRALRRVASTRPRLVPVQAVLRDVWSDHVLYLSVEKAIPDLVPRGTPPKEPRFFQGVDRSVQRRGALSTACSAPRQPERVVGVVDFHAAAVDTPATDLARLVGSWRTEPGAGLPCRAPRWHDAMEAYSAVRPLSPDERMLIPWLHATGVIFGLDNWFRWSLVEGRVFVRPARIVGRIDRLAEQLSSALAELHDRGSDAV
jgi:Ser/Thr protein kinase RdoA (MazF antagonist)